MSAGADRTTGRARRALVAAQVALAVTLMAGAGLLIRSFENLADVDPGFQTGRLAVAVLASANEGAGEPDLRADFEALRERAAAIPGVESATLTDSLPLWGFRSNRVKSPADGEEVDVVRQVVGPGYFETMRQPVLRGRGIAAADTAEAPLAVVVNQELARRFWPDSDPVGRTLEIELLGVAGEARVIGVAADALQDLKQPPRPQLYLAGAQVPRTRMSVIMRTALDPDALLGTIERDLSRVSPRLAMINVATFERHLLNSLFEERTSASVGGLTALLGLLLAAAGTWSVLTYVARSRRRETAVRIALGATRRDIVGRLLREAAGPVAAGAGAGAALTMASTRLLRAQLFGVEALDPATIVSAAAVVTACAALAALGPSLRASGIDPVVALRED